MWALDVTMSSNAIFINVMNDVEKSDALRKKRLILKSKHSHDSIVFSSLNLKYFVNLILNRTKKSYLNEKRLSFLIVCEIKNKIEIIDINFDINDIKNSSIFKKESSQKLYNSSIYLTFFMKNSFFFRCWCEVNKNCENKLYNHARQFFVVLYYLRHVVVAHFKIIIDQLWWWS